MLGVLGVDDSGVEAAGIEGRGSAAGQEEGQESRAARPQSQGRSAEVAFYSASRTYARTQSTSKRGG